MRTAALVLCVFAGAAAGPAADDTAKTADTFFAGAVTESTPEKITVGRTVRGRAESRTFQLTSETKIEGSLALKVRVTVRYVTDDDGDTATLIVVRPQVGRPAKQKK